MSRSPSGHSVSACPLMASPCPCLGRSLRPRSPPVPLLSRGPTASDRPLLEDKSCFVVFSLSLVPSADVCQHLLLNCLQFEVDFEEQNSILKITTFTMYT